MIALNKKIKVAFVSSFIPRKCGIATFTSDLINNIQLTSGKEFQSLVIAMQSKEKLKYDKLVSIKIRKDFKCDYLSAADYINKSDIDIVSIQHEFGLFGGRAGSYLSILLKRINKPIITTLHTVLENPPKRYFNTFCRVCQASDKLIVMNSRGIEMLQDIYCVPGYKINLIPHGIPELPFIDSSYFKRKLSLSKRKIILTFGLLGRNKGIEVMLKALPAIIKIDPSVLYIVLGATHPEVLRHEGYAYKRKLEKMVDDLKMQKNVVFYDRFVDDAELFHFLGAADVYVTPYLHKEQLTSGTLAFAVGAGKAIVSTPYWAAQDLLGNGRGILVRFGDSRHIASSIIRIFCNTSLFYGMRQRAYKYGRSMTWPKVGVAYGKLIESLTLLSGKQLSSPQWQVPAYKRQKLFQPA